MRSPETRRTPRGQQEEMMASPMRRRLRPIHWVPVGASVLAAVTVVCSLVALAEEITLTTTYPSPRGVYQELRTTSTALFATQQGSVAIGMDQTDPRFDPNSKLNVAGTMKTDSLRLTPTALLPTAAEGLIYLDPASGIRFFWQNTWNKIPIMKETPLHDPLILRVTFPLPTQQDSDPLGSKSAYNFLSIRLTPPQKGLYSVTWSAQVSVDAERGCKAKVGGGYTKTWKEGKFIPIDQMDIVDNEGTPDSDDDAKNGHYTTVDVDNGSILVLSQKLYEFWLSGFEQCSSSKIDAKVLPGATLTIETVVLY